MRVPLRAAVRGPAPPPVRGPRGPAARAALNVHATRTTHVNKYRGPLGACQATCRRAPYFKASPAPAARARGTLHGRRGPVVSPAHRPSWRPRSGLARRRSARPPAAPGILRRRHCAATARRNGNRAAKGIPGAADARLPIHKIAYNDVVHGIDQAAAPVAERLDAADEACMMAGSPGRPLFGMNAGGAPQTEGRPYQVRDARHRVHAVQISPPGPFPHIAWPPMSQYRRCLLPGAPLPPGAWTQDPNVHSSRSSSRRGLI